MTAEEIWNGLVKQKPALRDLHAEVTITSQALLRLVDRVWRKGAAHQQARRDAGEAFKNLGKKSSGFEDLFKDVFDTSG
jgi:hypothetical protein